MSNRPSGVLTTADREFLQSDGDYYEGKYARQDRYQRRRDIRGRITQSLLDFQDIRTLLTDKLRYQIFNEPEKNGAKNVLEFGAALESLIYWIYLGYRESGRDFKNLLTTPIRHAEEDYQQQHNGNRVNVEVNFKVNVTKRYEGVEEFSRRLMEGEPVLAESIYNIPNYSRFPIDPEKVDIVRIQPSSAQLHMKSEKTIAETILKEHLDIEAEVEIVGVIGLTDELVDGGTVDDITLDTAVVPPEEFNHR